MKYVAPFLATVTRRTYQADPEAFPKDGAKPTTITFETWMDSNGRRWGRVILGQEVG